MKSTTYILILFSLMSCNSKNSDTKPLINENSMEKILFDLHITEAYVSQLKLSSSNTLDTLSYYKQLVFEKHNVKETSFDQSMKYYSTHPMQLEDIYNNVKKLIIEKDLQIPHIDENELNETAKKRENQMSSIDSLKPFSKKISSN